MTVRARYENGVVWPAPQPHAPQALVCLSYSGGGTTGFRPWTRVLGNRVDLAVVCYRGREQRMSEPAARTWTELFEDALAAVRSVSGRPYVLFGHSLGAWVAYEVTVALQARGGALPRALVVSASDAPSRAATDTSRTPGSGASDRELLDWLRSSGQLPEPILAEPDLCAFAVELFRADLRATESYRFVPGRTVAVPLQVLRGAEDDQIDPDDTWSPLAAGPCRTDELPGGHFYTAKVWAQLPQRIAALGG